MSIPSHHWGPYLQALYCTGGPGYPTHPEPPLRTIPSGSVLYRWTWISDTSRATTEDHTFRLCTVQVDLDIRHIPSHHWGPYLQALYCTGGPGYPTHPEPPLRTIPSGSVLYRWTWISDTSRATTEDHTFRLCTVQVDLDIRHIPSHYWGPYLQALYCTGGPGYLTHPEPPLRTIPSGSVLYRWTWISDTSRATTEDHTFRLCTVQVDLDIRHIPSHHWGPYLQALYCTGGPGYPTHPEPPLRTIPSGSVLYRWTWISDTSRATTEDHTFRLCTVHVDLDIRHIPSHYWGPYLQALYCTGGPGYPTFYIAPLAVLPEISSFILRKSLGVRSRNYRLLWNACSSYCWMSCTGTSRTYRWKRTQDVGRGKPLPPPWRNGRTVEELITHWLHSNCSMVPLPPPPCKPTPNRPAQQINVIRGPNRKIDLWNQTRGVHRANSLLAWTYPICFVNS